MSKRKRWLLIVAALGCCAGILGFLVAASGVIPIKASSGHWALTEWMLHFSMRRSIATHTLGDELPALDDPALVLKGAGHYEAGCKPCHGSPELHEPRVARAMLPPPPDLKYAAHKWQAEELFYIVRHGIKFTGMPAWPSPRRDDEVQAVVAFLEALPGLDADEYRALVHGPAGEPAGGAALAELSGRAPGASTGCVRCHGRHGEGRENAAFPRLAGQRQGYTLAALDAYANDQRYSGIMQPIAAALNEHERRELAAFYSAQPRPRIATQTQNANATQTQHANATQTQNANATQTQNANANATQTQNANATQTQNANATQTQHANATQTQHANATQTQSANAPNAATPSAVNARASARGEADRERIARGREIALRGIPAQRVPACSNCHGPRPERSNPTYPRLAGQFADYLVLQLELFQRGERGGSKNKHLMQKAAPPLHPDQMRDVAAFYAALSDDEAGD